MHSRAQNTPAVQASSTPVHAVHFRYLLHVQPLCTLARTTASHYRMRDLGLQTGRNPYLHFPMNKPIRLTQCCIQFRSLGVKVLCVFYLHDNIAFTFKWYGNTWNKTFCSQRIWIGYHIELAELVYCSLYNWIGEHEITKIKKYTYLLRIQKKRNKNKHNKTWMKWNDTKWTCEYYVNCGHTNEMKMWSSQSWWSTAALTQRPLVGVPLKPRQHFSGLICDCLKRNHNCDYLSLILCQRRHYGSKYFT